MQQMDESKPVRLCAWDRKGKVYRNLVDAIIDARGYCRNFDVDDPDFEEIKLKWMWADHPVILDGARRCNPLRWSTWKHPRNTVAEMEAHTTGQHRPVRLVAQSVKNCDTVTDAISFLEELHLKYMT